MAIRSLLVAAALAAQASAQGCANPGAKYSVQTLHYNNLGPQNNGTAFVAVRDAADYNSAAAACTGVGESLVTISGLSESDLKELQYQLSYLASTDDLGDDVAFWVKGEDGKCATYSPSSSKIGDADCGKSLLALCTNSAPPTTEDKTGHEQSTEITVQTDELSVRGYRDQRSFRFLSIPFANAPTGKLRFMAPQKYTGKKEIDGTKMPASCMQAASDYGDTRNLSEDCLYVNVFTPLVPAHRATKIKRRPVAVYFYGGAFVEGAISLVDYDGGNFASRSDVVIVTVNYRLGALGFLASKSAMDGSMGIKDQVAALQWVKDNIAAFGGDADQVTIFGQSAGGQSVVALLSSSAAKGLFKGAISQSAPVDLPWFTRDVYTEYVTPAVTKAVGCSAEASEKDLLACLQKVPAEQFLSSSKSLSSALSTVAASIASNYFHSSLFVASVEPILPMIDDTKSGVIDGQFYDLVKSGKLPCKVPVMFSTVTNEGTLFVNSFLSTSIGSSQQTLDATLGAIFTQELADKIEKSGAFEVDTSDPDGTRNTIGDLITHASWTCAQSFILDSAGDVFPAIYQVEVGSGHQQSNAKDVTSTCFPNNSYNATCHTADVLPVWGNVNSKTKGTRPYYDNNDLLHSQFMNDIWGAFFHTGNPQPDAEVLAKRGPAYAYSTKTFAKGGYEVEQYKANAKELPLLSIPPTSTANPGETKQCAVFKDYGFTFQHAKVDLSVKKRLAKLFRRW